MLRVLHVHSGNMFGGVERVLLSIASVDPSTAGLEHEFALAFEGRLFEQLKPTHRTHLLGAVQIRKPWTVLAARRRLRSLLRQSRWDMVLLHSAWSQAVFGRVAQSVGYPQVYWVHDALDGRHWLQRWASRTPPDLLICSSKFVSSTLPLVYPHVAFELVHYPLVFHPIEDEAERAIVRRRLGAGPDEVVIVQLSRLEPYKGHELLLRALEQLAGSARWKLWVVGGPQREEEHRYLSGLERLARELMIADRVQFVGQSVDVPRLLAGGDIFCQPNISPEPFGLTFIEAMHTGLPVVTGDFGGGAEAVGEAGLLVEPGSVTALADGLRSLIESPILRRELGSLGPARARELTDPVRQTQRLGAVLSERFSTKR